jgi:penicillin-binding protein 2
VDKIQEVAKKIGYMQTYDIGVGNQKTGSIPSRAWKANYNRNNPNPDSRVWYPGETLSVAIGQGDVNVTALQLAVTTARFANARKAILPRLIKSVGGVDRPSGAEVPDLPFSREHLEIVRQGMVAVANDRTGGAYRQSQLGLGDIQMAGKTGTAQVRSYGTGSRTSNVWALKDHNLFVAFAPVDAPRYAVAVIVEHGGKGGATAAAPRAREVMRTVLLKDPEMLARIQRPLPPEALAPETAEGIEAGAAPEDPVDAPVAPAPRPAAPAPTTGPRPYIPDAPQ